MLTRSFSRPIPGLLHPLFLIVLMVFGAGPASIAQEPSSKPILRLETGMHTAPIRRISVDAEGRFLVTASDDKTARVWDVATGQLLRVLRPPVGPGDEGKLFSAAISPDGGTVAVGGWTKNGNSESIYLFDRVGGRLVQRLGGLPNVVLHLVFSPDSKYLAATLGGENGVRVYEGSNWNPIGSDTDYGGSSYRADFDRSGRLVTSCLDGFIRLYAVSPAGLQQTIKKTASGGKEPYAIRFSPDGSKIAVGFHDSTNVNVLSAADLGLLFAPDTSDVSDDESASVAWSAKGDALYAGGNRRIRFWKDGGRGVYQDITASSNSIGDILPIPGGGGIYGAADPAWGMIDAGGKRTRLIESGIADYRGLLSHFLSSTDGSEIQFFYSDSASLTRFPVAERALQKAEKGKPGLRAPKVEGLNVTEWENTLEPKLNGQKLELDRYERSRSLAVAPDNSKFLLGANWSIRLFDRTGNKLWKLSAPSAAWSVNISGDGRLAIAALGDGTIRWYRITDGTELLAFFPHKDKKRWVLWTPSGYYDASPDAEDLIGWHVNNGKDTAADFFPVGLFRSQFYRPDVVSKILYTADEAKAVAFANEEAGRRPQEQTDLTKQLPPVVAILSPADSAGIFGSSVKVRFQIRTPSGEPVTEVKAFVDGNLVTPKGVNVVSAGGDTRDLEVPVPEKDCEISIIAKNRFTSSAPAIVSVKWKGRTAADDSILKPTLYILAVGVSNYSNSAYNLSFAAKDARDFAALMQKQKGGLYRDVVVRLLTDEKATRDDIADGLEWTTTQATSRDVVMIFLSGHGIDNGSQYSFCPYNFDKDKIFRTGVAFSDIRRTIEDRPYKRIVFVDTCYSGNAMGSKIKSPDINGFINELSSAENGAVVFAASTGKQFSLEDPAWGNGAFTKALLEGLGGKADLFGKGKVTITTLDAYIADRVKDLTGGRQTPATRKPDTVPDFPLTARF